MKSIVANYNPQAHRSTIDFEGFPVTIAFYSSDFIRVFGIPTSRKVVAKPTMKITTKEKESIVYHICKLDIMPQEKETIWNTGRQGLRKQMLGNANWKCIMDLIKCKLIGANQASDIATWMVEYMFGLSTGKIYNWSLYLSDWIREFLACKHKAFYMTQHLIALFLDVVCNQVPKNKLGKWQPAKDYDKSWPSMFKWAHLDTQSTNEEEGRLAKRKRK